jgi:hypothetical protein
MWRAYRSPRRTARRMRMKSERRSWGGRRSGSRSRRRGFRGVLVGWSLWVRWARWKSGGGFLRWLVAVMKVFVVVVVVGVRR